ncbi:MAG TPA: hypothetical protein VHC91_26035 [Trinickia sp.]|uniref:hypothetical protein n=1 Tax=Trinickia sp. TaxID=2571163 RepID=UPI002CC3C347|nr:hypothetical protein [Trinickia sp.]HVW53829.1 hypothetical protein [Trinickia sp.]
MYNPAADLDLPKVEERLPKHVLTIEKVERVLNLPGTTTALGMRDRAMLETLYSTGSGTWRSSGCSSATSTTIAAR